MQTITDYQITHLNAQSVKAAARINFKERSHEVSFTIKGASDLTLDAGLEPFLTLALIPAMATGQAISLPGPVSLRLLANIETIQSIYSLWDRAFNKVAVNSQPLPSKSPNPFKLSVLPEFGRRLLNKAGQKTGLKLALGINEKSGASFRVGLTLTILC